MTQKAMLSNAATVCAIAAIAVLMLTTTGSLADAAPQKGGDDKREAGRNFQWTDMYGAKSMARTKLYGIVIYIPPKGSQEIHDMFETQRMFEQSLKSPIVRVLSEELQTELHGRYGTNTKRFCVVVTDWHGNLIEKFEAKKKHQKLPMPKILSLVENTRSFVKKLEKDLKKAYAKGEKEFEKKKWKKALKELLFCANSQGFDECDKAKAFISDIETVGLEQIEKIEHTAITDSEGAIKELKRVAREFAGCAAETKAHELIEKIKNKDS